MILTVQETLLELAENGEFYSLVSLYREVQRIYKMVQSIKQQQQTTLIYIA